MRALRTSRLTLEPQTAEHADEMFCVLSDPAIYEFENEPPPSAAWLRERYARLESRRSADGREQWLNWVVRGASSELIGYVQATVHADSRATIAYEFASRHWGQGLAGDAVRAMANELILEHRVTRLCAVLKSANFRSLRLLERLGFVLASQKEQAAVEPDEIAMVRPAEPFAPRATRQ